MKELLSLALPNEEFVENFRPDWLKNPATGANLELDRYYPRLLLGFEFNGPQHRKEIGEKQWERDKLKKHLCAKHGVLRIVFYWGELSMKRVVEKISDSHLMRASWKNGKPWIKRDNPK